MSTADLANTGLLAPKKAVLFCSFCGKPQHQAAYLIIGQNVGICDECVNQANDMVVRWRIANAKEPPS